MWPSCYCRYCPRGHPCPACSLPAESSSRVAACLPACPAAFLPPLLLPIARLYQREGSCRLSACFLKLSDIQQTQAGPVGSRPSEGMTVSTCWGVSWKASLALHSTAFMKQASTVLPALGAYLVRFWGRVGAEACYSPQTQGKLWPCAQPDL